MRIPKKFASLESFRCMGFVVNHLQLEMMKTNWGVRWSGLMRKMLFIYFYECSQYLSSVFLVVGGWLSKQNIRVWVSVAWCFAFFEVRHLLCVSYFDWHKSVQGQERNNYQTTCETEHTYCSVHFWRANTVRQEYSPLIKQRDKYELKQYNNNQTSL